MLLLLMLLHFSHSTAAQKPFYSFHAFDKSLGENGLVTSMPLPPPLPTGAVVPAVIGTFSFSILNGRGALPEITVLVRSVVVE